MDRWLAMEAFARAVESGSFVGAILSGRCYEFERILPYQPIVETLRSALPSLSTSEQALVPRGFLGDASEWSSEGQAGLFESMVNFLAGLSAQGPILIVLEDLHWAAESTLQMLHYLARHLVDHSIMLIGTVRSEEVTSGTLFLNFQQALQKEKLCASLLLARLSTSAVEKLILEMSGGEDSVEPLVQRLYRETEGNPFFLMETVKALFARR